MVEPGIVDRFGKKIGGVFAPPQIVSEFGRSIFSTPSVAAGMAKEAASTVGNPVSGMLYKATNSFFKRNPAGKILAWGAKHPGWFGTIIGTGVLVSKLVKEGQRTLKWRPIERPSKLGTGPGYISYSKCLAESTYLFCKINDVYTFSSLKDLKRLPNSEIYVPGIDKNYNIIWTKIIKFYDTEKKSGIQIICDDGSNTVSTLDHKHLCLFNGKLMNKNVSEIEIGDIICNVSNIPVDERNFPDIFDLEWAWFIGIFVAEGNKTDDGFVLSLNKDEVWIAERVLFLFKNRFGISGSYKIDNVEDGNGLLVRVYGGKFVHALLNEFVNNNIAVDKYLSTKCFNFGKEWFEKFMHGYLIRDGCYDEKNNRWENNITVNYMLTYQLKCICKILGWRLRHAPRIVRNKKLNKEYSALRMEIKKNFNHCFVYKPILQYKNIREVKVINKVNVTNINFIDVEVESSTHLFILANGIITHNSSGMPYNHLSSEGVGLSLSNLRHSSII